MTIKILDRAELLRAGHYEDILELSRPPQTNFLCHMDDKECTVFCSPDLVDDFEMWPTSELGLRGWHLWEHADVEEELLKYRHLINPKTSAWAYFGYADQTYSTPKDLADEFIFRLEVYLHHAE